MLLENMTPNIEECPQVFQILTKFPGNLFHWARSHGLPENVWAGVTVCTQSMVTPAVNCVSAIDAAVKYVCVEPFQEGIVISLSRCGLDDHWCTDKPTGLATEGVG
jgi:protein gp37